jgi:hypothetical protein
MHMTETTTKHTAPASPIPVIAASYIGPPLMPNRDALWEENELPLNADALVNEVMGQPMRRAGRFIKMVACGGLACLQQVSPDYLKGRKRESFWPPVWAMLTKSCLSSRRCSNMAGGFPVPTSLPIRSAMPRFRDGADLRRYRNRSDRLAE